MIVKCSQFWGPGSKGPTTSSMTSQWEAEILRGPPQFWESLLGAHWACWVEETQLAIGGHLLQSRAPTLAQCIRSPSPS